MTDYTNTFGGAAKDSANSTILGADHDTQYDSIATMSATKANKVASATTDGLATLSAAGDLKNGGVTIAGLKSAIFDIMYPVGSIHQSTSSTNPGTSMGYGTWTQIAKGRTLIGEGTGAGLTARTAGATGGSEDAVVVQHNHTLTDPGHTHDVTAASVVSASANTAWWYGTDNGADHTEVTSSETTGITVDNEGVSGVDANMPPYLVVYIWERTA